jgi:hypothetical protein
MANKKHQKTDKQTTLEPGSGEYVGFTVTGQGYLNQFFLDVQVAENLPDNAENPDDKLIDFKSGWNLSLARTQVSQNLVNKLGLRLDDKIDLYLPNKIRIAALPIIIGNFQEGIDCMIGMDVTNSGDISVSGSNGKTTFSFRTPPQGQLDFVVQRQQQSKKNTTISSSSLKKNSSISQLFNKSGTALVSRSQPCPCGSGKKHGNCCARIH